MSAAEARKTFVLDTNVILHDSSCLTQFKRHGIVIPITVLEELDQFKKGNQSINYHAREFLRSLDALGGAAIFDGGVRIGPGHGTVRIQLERELHPDLVFNFSRSKPDDLILNCAYTLARENKRSRVVLVSKDVNLRLKAKAVGLMSDDYLTDHVKDIATLYTGKREVTDLDVSVIDRLYAGGAVPPEHLALGTPLIANENLILRNHQKSALARFVSAEGLVRRVNKAPVYGISPRNAEQTFALSVLCDPEIPLVSLTGTAGTGKTLLVLAAALEQRRLYRQIFLARPIVPLSNKDIGYLPGEVKAKLDPYMQPIYDNLAVIMSHNGNGDGKPANQQIQQMLDEEKLTVSALPYIRGRSLNRIFFIVDEAQNLTPHEVKTIITRAGEGTKIVFTGDVFQIDHPYLDAQSNGLSYLIEKMQGQRLYAHVNLEKGERSKLAHLASELL
ncbi:MAG TPA: PhoH family protein [Candidatus Dormibacteraeota bacterium]|nr:PhoH family protein [Candidatus Dormibacteraeota bacterium]